jgi:hypothetical protein
MRPTTFKVDNTVYWTIRTYTDAGVLVDADSTPSVAVRKNGSSVADSVTVTKRAATTGIYDCSYNPAGEVEGDCFTIEETATVASQAYENAWSLEAQASERGTDGVSADIAAMKAVTDKVDTMLESDTGDIVSGFETGFDGWAAVAYLGGNASHTALSTDEARTGTLSIRMLNDGSDGSNDRTGIVRTETLGSSATISGYFFSTRSTPSTDQRIELWIDGVFDSSQDPTAGQTWEFFTFILPSGSHDIALVRHSDENNGSGNVHVDDVTITGVASSDYQYTAASLDQAPSGGGGGGDATAANQTSIINAISSLNDFDPATDEVITDTASRNASKADVSGLSTFDHNSDQVVASNMRGTDGANTVAPVDVSSDVTAILVDTNELQQNQGDWATATGFSTFDHTSDAVITDTASRNASKADVSGLSTFDPSTDEVVTDAASRAASKADVSGLSTFDHTSDQVVASNMRGTDGANTVAPDNASIIAILADTNELQGNQADWATATGFATPADLTAALSPVVTSIGNLNDFDPALDVVAHVTLVDTTTDLTNGGGGGGGASASDIYDYFTDGTREDAFKADTAGLSTFDPASDTVARVTLVDTTTDLTNQTAGGIGMFQASVLITDSTGNALQGARVNVDGTTLSLTTGVSGEVQFNLDSGVYLLNVLPPANYDTPIGQVLTITASDPAQTVFTLTSTSPPDGCDVPWIG